MSSHARARKGLHITECIYISLSVCYWAYIPHVQWQKDSEEDARLSWDCTPCAIRVHFSQDQDTPLCIPDPLSHKCTRGSESSSHTHLYILLYCWPLLDTLQIVNSPLTTHLSNRAKTPLELELSNALISRFASLVAGRHLPLSSTPSNAHPVNDVTLLGLVA